MRLNVLGVRQGQRAMVYGSLLFLVIFYGGFRLWPMAYSIVLSLFNWRGLKPIWEQTFVWAVTLRIRPGQRHACTGFVVAHDCFQR